MPTATGREASDNCPGRGEPRPEGRTTATASGRRLRQRRRRRRHLGRPGDRRTGTDPLKADSDGDGDGSTPRDNCPHRPRTRTRHDGDSDGVGTACDPLTSCLPRDGARTRRHGTRRRRQRLTGTVGGRCGSPASSGNDVLSGLAGDDCLSGGRGKGPALTGWTGERRARPAGRGRTATRAARGKDRINARNHVNEKVRCGPGKDRARVDPGDRTFGCERVRRQLRTLRPRPGPARRCRSRRATRSPGPC